ncbi:acyl-CoA synthetase [Pseudoteredinibacter isoporae]|uniref:acyl-CoA synthetase n=1 Tax=Pseudoteredinibacter isoporae TaxID=570281 RepID=UPI0031087F33
MTISTQEDLQALESVPFEERIEHSSTYDLLRDKATQYADRIALSFLLQGSADEEPIRYSYKDLFGKITQTANALNQLGVESDDTVSMLLPNLPHTHFTIWGSEAAGIFNPINPLLEVEHIAAILNEAKTKVLVTLAPFPGTELWDKALAVKAQVPSLTHILAVDMARFLTPELAGAMTAERQDYLGEDVLDFDDTIAQHNADTLDSGRNICRSDIASYFHTGGTTGTPKLAPHTHFNELTTVWQMSAGLDIGPGAVSLTGLPLFHVNAVFVTGLATWSQGAEAVLASPQGYRNPTVIKDFWRIVERYKVSYFSCVPTILSALIDIPMDDADVSSLDFCLCGAAPLATELIRNFESKTGLSILEGYGQTEGTCASTANPRHGERKVGAVGLRLPYMEMRIVEVDENGHWLRDCETNESGCIAIKGPNVFNGYKQAAQNEGQWVEKDWFNTGDLGRLDEQGYLWLTGRSKDLIIRGGHNIDPQMIEEVFYTHPDVAEAVAIGKPDKRVGEVPVVYLQLKPEQEADQNTFLDFAMSKIAERAAVPKEIHFVDEMPVTAVGKIFKPDLRNDIVKKVVDHHLAEHLSALDARFTVETSKKHGQLVRFHCSNVERLSELVREHIGEYTFATTVEQA